MKLKRFVASDMKTALNMIRDELGSDAIIMSNKRVDEGVEIVAGVETSTGPKNNAAGKGAAKTPAQVPRGSIPTIREPTVGFSAHSRYDELDDDEVTLTRDKAKSNGAAALPSAKPKAAPAAPAPAPKPQRKVTNINDIKPKIDPPNQSQTFAKSLIEILERQKEQGTLPQSKSASETRAPSSDGDYDTPPMALFESDEFKALFEKSKAKFENEALAEEDGIDSYGSQDKESLHQMQEEVAVIRRLLQFELAGLLSESKFREEPVKAMVSKLLHSAGFSDQVCDILTENVNADASFNFAWREIAQILTDNLIVGEDEIVREGGIVSLVGPAGVGKTTTLAKLAARFVMKFGAESLAIICADNYRIGAMEQVKTYGRIMGCTCMTAKSLNELPEILYALKNKSLVLIDTAGVGLKDELFGTQLAQLKLQSALKIKHYLVIPVTSQQKVLNQVYEHFKSVDLSGLILTKVDESQSLGDALSLCIEKKLRISYIADGQRVPEDLSVPDKRVLAIKALSCVEDDAVISALS